MRRRYRVVVGQCTVGALLPAGSDIDEGQVTMLQALTFAIVGGENGKRGGRPKFILLRASLVAALMELF